MDTPSLFQIRLRAPHTASDAQWDATFRALSENRAACDEVWLSTGIAFPAMDWHRGHARRLGRYAAMLRGAGIAPSLQFQATLGHGDAFGGSPEEMAGRTWSGFTGPSGVECRACNCPRQPAFLAYVRETARIYAESIRPDWLWIDDDLRVNNHLPAVSHGECGCWCGTCIAAFNSATGGNWDRASLAAAVGESPSVRAAWNRFSFESIADIARAVAEETHAASPGTRFGYQHGGWPDDSQLAVFAALRDAGGGRPVGSRPGGGHYYDLDPNGPVRKAFMAARQKRVLGSPDWITAWLPEIETFPRSFASRTARGVLLEALASLAYGMNGISAFVMDTRAETDEWYSENILAPIAACRGVIGKYRDANLGTEVAGLDAPASLPIDGIYQYALSGIPVVPGTGATFGAMADADASVAVSKLSSRGQAGLRDEADARSGWRLPAIADGPSVGLVVPRVGRDGALRTVMVLNARIEERRPSPLKLRLRQPEAGGAARAAAHGGPQFAIWRSIGEPDRATTLPITASGGASSVTVPRMGPWDAGWLEIPRP